MQKWLLKQVNLKLFFKLLRVSDMWRSLEDTGETRGVGGTTGSGTWPTNVGGRKSKLRESRERG